MLVVIAGVENVLFCCVGCGVPPVATVYHRYWPGLAPEAIKVMLDPEQPELSMAPGTGGGVRTMASTGVRIALSQPVAMSKMVT